MQQKEFKTKFLDEEIQCYYIKEASQAADALAIMMEQDGIIAVDTETEALPEWHAMPDAPLSPHLAKIRLIQTYNGRAACVFDLKYLPFKMFIPFLETKKFVAHNAVFDIGQFKKAGVTDMDVSCTYQIFKMICHASRPDDEGLKGSLAAICLGLFNMDLSKGEQTQDWSTPELNFAQVEYAALDAIAVLKIASKMAPAIESYGMWRYYNLIKAAQDAVVAMQLNGITLDVAAHRNLIDEWMSKLILSRKQVVSILGSEDVTPHTVADYLEHNLDKDTLSLWPRTDTGKLQTDVNAFSNMGNISPIIVPFAEFSKLKTLSSGFGHKLLQLINPATGKIHCSFKLQGARSGRMSCSSPNLQQCPHDEKFRSNFVSEPGTVFVCGDLNQIELRICAELSQDQAMQNAFRQGLDLHSVTASRISGKPIDQISKTDRQLGKCLGFGLAFGLGANGLSKYAKRSYNVSINPDDSKDLVKSYREAYPQFYAWQKERAEEGATTLLSRTVCGKLRKLDPERSYTTALNNPVQGSAAEVLMYMLVKLQAEADSQGYALRNTVHDEVCVSVEDSEIKIANTKKCLEEAAVWAYRKVFGSKAIVRGLINVGAGRTWKDAKEA